jgi:hypothetical protein
MKTNRNVLKAVAAALLTLSGGLAGATGTQDLTVTATISTICRFTTGAAIAIPFGTIDPSSTGAKTAAISVPYKCTKGTTAPGIQITAGGTSMAGASTTLAYSIGSFTTAAGAGFAAAAANATATATITQAAYSAAEADTYTDTVTLTIDN